MRVLVVYGSTHGGTAGLAGMIAEALVAHEVPTDLGDAAEVDDLSDYDVAIVGGALHNGRWHRDARRFVLDHAEALRAMPVWFFSSGPLDHSARNGAIAPVDGVRRLAREIDVRGHMTFGGRLRAEDVLPWDGFRHRHRVGDYRDPQQVEEWVRRIVAQLAVVPGDRSG